MAAAGNAVLVAIVVLIALLLVQPADAVTVVSPDAQWQPWALKWERMACAQRRVVVRLHRQLGLKAPQRVPQPAAFIVWPDDPGGVGLQSWRLFGLDSHTRQLRALP